MHIVSKCAQRLHFLHYYQIYQGQRINSLGPSDAIWWQRSGSTLAHIMACCLTAPSHYLNQCWLIITKVQWCSSQGNFTWDIASLRSSDVHLGAISLEILQPSVTKIPLKIIFLRFYWNLPGANQLICNNSFQSSWLVAGLLSKKSHVGSKINCCWKTSYASICLVLVSCCQILGHLQAQW